MPFDMHCGLRLFSFYFNLARTRFLRIWLSWRQDHECGQKRLFFDLVLFRPRVPSRAVFLGHYLILQTRLPKLICLLFFLFHTYRDIYEKYYLTSIVLDFMIATSQIFLITFFVIDLSLAGFGISDHCGNPLSLFIRFLWEHCFSRSWQLRFFFQSWCLL